LSFRELALYSGCALVGGEKMQIWTSTIGQRLDGAENTRTMLLCDQLLRQGHEVTLWTSAYDHIRKQWREEWLAHGEAGYRMSNGLVVRFMKGCGYKSNVSVARLIDHILAARDLLRQAASLPAPDALVASLPDHITADAMVRYGRSVGATTFVDVRDKWPDIFIDHAPNLMLKLVVRTGLVFETARARRALRDADGLVAMMNSMMVWGLRKAGRNARETDRVFYLTTTPRNFGIDRPVVDLPAGVRAALAAVKGRTVFAFVGTFNRTQHPGLLLDAIDLLAARGQLDPGRVAFLIGGSGVGAEEITRRAGSYDCVHDLGWLDTGTMLEVLASSDVGLLLMNFASPAFNNKAFAYLASGIPIINGATGDLAELVEERGVGINVPGGNVEALADAIVRLASDATLLADGQAKVRVLFDELFDRDSNYAAYIAHIEAVTAAKTRALTAASR
jgi:glycosyltransferase involved in cell wall biosynthesis